MRKTRDVEAVLAEERRAGRWAAGAGLGSLLAAILSVLLANAASAGSGLSKGPAGADGRDADRLRGLLDVDAHTVLLGASTLLRCVGLLLMIGLGLYLIRLVRTRDARAIPSWVVPLTWAAPILLSVVLVVGLVASIDVADALTSSGPRTAERAARLVDDSTGVTIAQAGDLVLRIPVAIWIGVVAVAAMRVGLLTRFLGYWGVAAGVCLVLLAGGGDALLVGWVGSVGLLALGWWPGGRPAAWEHTTPQPIEAI